MSHIKNPLEIYKMLPKTNCRQCYSQTCLAFADAVFKGQKQLKECPHLEDHFVEQLEGKISRPLTLEEQQELMLEEIKKKIATVDLAAAAERLGGSFSGGKLRIKCLGREFAVDTRGNVTSDCHINSWVTVPLLNYILSGKGVNPTGRWVAFRELKNGKDRQPLFGQRCEKPLKEIADANEDFFEDLLSLFGKPINDENLPDTSFVLHALPKVPILISYERVENGTVSKLNVLFDALAEENLHAEFLHMLASGIVTMLEKISRRHG